MHGKLYTLASSNPGTHGEGEKVICADAATGKVLWENKFNVYLSDVPDTRVAWSCCVGDPTTGRVYAMGVCGYLQCLDGDTGKTLWSRSLSEEFGLLSTYGGRTNVPVVFDDLVIISAVTTSWGELARPMHRFMAFNKATGELVWINGTRPLPDDTTYSTPFLAVVNGQPLMVFGSGDGSVWAFQPRTGKPVWSFRFSLRGLNVSPLVDNNIVYMGQSEENREDSTMGAFGGVSRRWHGRHHREQREMAPQGSDGRQELAAVAQRPDLCLGRFEHRVRAGRRDGGRRRQEDAAARHDYACQPGLRRRQNFRLHDQRLARAGADRQRRKARPGFAIPDGEEIYGSPVVSHGRIYVPTTAEMYCIGTPDTKPDASRRRSSSCARAEAE